MDSLETEVLESYFKRYFPSAKLYRTYGGQDVFFHDLVKFLLEVACVNPRQYCMLKQWAGFIREQLHGVQQGKPVKSIFPLWLRVLCPPRATETRLKTLGKEKG